MSEQKEAIRVLILEDLPSDAQLAQREVKKAIENVVFECVETEENFVEALDRFRPDVIISDYHMPVFDGLSALKISLEKTPITPFIIHTGSQNEDTAVACMKAGATDYVLKDRMKRLGPAVKEALKNREVQEEKLLAEETLRQNESLFRIAGTLARVGGWSVNLETNRVTWSDEVADIHEMPRGYHPTVEEGIRFYAPESLERITEVYTACVKEGIPYDEELQIITGKGRKVWVRTIGVAERDNEGKVARIHGGFQDITLMKRQERKLQQALERAKESDRLKTAFLNNISHEVRTPLNSILGFSNLLKDMDLGQEELRHFVQIIQRSGQQLLQVITDVISMASLEAGQEQLRQAPVDIRRLMRKRYEHFIEKLHNERVSLSFGCELADEEAVVISDEYKLIQVLDKLLDNAIKFTEKGRVSFSCRRLNGFLHFSVTDTGVGIDPRHHELIFERFRQVTPPSGKVVEGNGLGLSIARSYVRLLGGEIKVDSKLAGGSVFHFTIPFKKPKNKQERHETVVEPGESKGESALILVAEDEVSNYELLENLLKPLAYRILHAENGEQAVRKVRELPDIDLVLMDIKMPVMGGLEATRLIKGERPGLPVIAITAHALEGDRQKAMSAGCDDYLGKPIRRDDLLKKIRSALHP